MSITTALEARRDALREREAGFTLIELLVVVIIIGILAAIAIPIYLGVQNNAKDSAVKSDLTNGKTAIVAAAVDQNGNMPTAITAGSKTDVGGSATIAGANGAVNLVPYGWSKSNNTDALSYNYTAPTGADAAKWCLVGTSSSGKYFSISATGATKTETTATCTPA